MTGFQVGDIVTRDGTDRQRVVEVGGWNDITVECTVAPETGWCAVGDRELNLAGRYQLVRARNRASCSGDHDWIAVTTIEDQEEWFICSRCDQRRTMPRGFMPSV